MKKYVRNFRPAGFQRGDLNPSRKPERRKDLSEQRKGKITPDETKEKISISMKKALENPELREKWSQKARGRKLSPETKSKIVATRRKNHPPTMKGITLKLDNIFSMYKRLLNTNDDGYIKCFTCGRYFTYADIDCGHYISRTHKSIRWLDENTEPQCRSCNRFHEGVKDIFALNLVRKYGASILQELDNKKNQIKKYTVPELDGMLEEYREKIEQLKLANRGG